MIHMHMWQISIKGQWSDKHAHVTTFPQGSKEWYTCTCDNSPTRVNGVMNMHMWPPLANKGNKSLGRSGDSWRKHHSGVMSSVFYSVRPLLCRHLYKGNKSLGRSGDSWRKHQSGVMSSVFYSVRPLLCRNLYKGNKSLGRSRDRWRKHHSGVMSSVFYSVRPLLCRHLYKGNKSLGRSWDSWRKHQSGVIFQCVVFELFTV